VTVFIRLLSEKEKELSLLKTALDFRQSNEPSELVFDIDADALRSIEGSPFSYWINESGQKAFTGFGPFKNENRLACVTNEVGEDARFYRLWWEVSKANDHKIVWVPLSKGGKYSPYYFDLALVVAWSTSRNTYFGFTGSKHRPMEKPASVGYFFQPGVSWPSRTSSELGIRALPRGAIFANKGPSAFVSDFDLGKTLFVLAMGNSKPFRYLVNCQLAAGDAAARSYDVGVINRTPFPNTPPDVEARLSALARKSCLLMRRLDMVDENSHAFVLPYALRERFSHYDPPSILSELAEIQDKIDEIAFDLYGFSAADRAGPFGSSGAVDKDDGVEDISRGEDENIAEAIDQTDGLLSWAVGVAFGRFDWRLATGEREAPPEPEPFDPLPTKSPGMLPGDADPFYTYSGILVDDQGNPNDIAHLTEEVLARVEAPLTADVRRWLRRDFFPLHLKQYSKSRRKAPIYWPISTSSGSYTLWLYYPSLTGQTLFSAVNDFIEPKLNQVGQDVTALRTKGSARSRDDEKSFEALLTLELELIELRDTLLAIAQNYRPNHDDGVQITAAPLWQLFRHKPWQKVLKDTWEKLEAGEYDWAHLAYSYWPDRVREKCKTDKSLAIAHGLEELYEEPAA
jgi:hypothetical protein